jgi:hypothetical protein
VADQDDGSSVRCATKEEMYAASVATPRRRFGGENTVKP